MTTVEKYWNTWDPGAFTWMRHLKSGLCVVPGAFSEAERAYSEFRFDETMHLHEHDMDGRYCRLTAGHAHAEFELEYLKPDPWTVLLRLRNTVAPREWGLRFHMLCSVGYPGGEGDMYLVPGGALCGVGEEYHAAVAFYDKPYNITLAEEHDAVGCRMADKGFKADWREEAQKAPWATGRFTLEAGPELRLAVSLSTDPARARAAAESALSVFDNWEVYRAQALDRRPRSASAEYPGMLEAVGDIMAWNDMTSPPLGREYTCIAKAWNESFGDWYLFFSDACYQIFLKSLAGDAVMAERNLDFVLTAATPAGNFAGLYSGFQKWVDRTQPPVLGFSLLMSYYHTGNKTALEKALPSLIRSAEWYLYHRDARQKRLVQLGTSDTGKGDYRRTKIGAKNEAAMDNSPMYDEAVYNEETGMLDMHDVGISSLLALDMECTVRIARILGREEEAGHLEGLSDEVKRAVHDRLWDSENKIFANRHLDGPFGLASPTSFYPLAAGIADGEQLEGCISHIFDPQEFFTECPMIAINAKDPSARENKYWRGRTWAPQSFWTYIGLRRAGRDGEAHELARAVLKHFERHWNGARRAYENYNPYTGEGSDSVDSNGFYSWTALMPAMWALEQLSVDPWNGLCFGFPDGAPCVQENRLIGGERYTLRCGDGETTLSAGGGVLFRSDISARFKGFVREPHYRAVTVDAPAAGWVEFPDAQAVRATVDGAETPASNRVEISAGNHKIELFCR